MRVLVAMSGGVDSSVAAARCIDAGHDVTGVHLALSRSASTLRVGSRGCCSREDSHDARRVADKLGIPFYVWDFADKFQQEVVDNFVSAYAGGVTPNPCVRCNEKIKFHALAQRAFALGFDAVATGHYARLTLDDAPVLRRAVDYQKDQSYVLASLTPEQLQRCIFPLGDTPKEIIRQQAHERGFSVATKPDSHDICFIPSGDTKAFLGQRIGTRPGVIIDESTGERVAMHSGIFGFTIGQRKGLGLAGPAKDGKPRYVTGIDPDTDVVTVGTIDRLKVDYLVAESMVWHTQPDPSQVYRIQVRAHGGLASAKIVYYEDTQVVCELITDLYGVACGQTVVFYSPDEILGDRVIGAGKIIATCAPDHEDLPTTAEKYRVSGDSFSCGSKNYNSCNGVSLSV